MGGSSCNGTCHRHPDYSPKRLVGKYFRANIDAICRVCEAYFHNLKSDRCPCCKLKIGRHVRKGRAFKHKVFTAFADFWRRILREKKQYEIYRKMEIKRKPRHCLICNGTKTAFSRGSPMWNRYLYGWLCSTCYNREKYRERVAKKKGIVYVLQTNHRK